mmetsp:Transcript_32934/g.24254  ORF Transcript_32934/g.24254 Transcript_32934/m.24254 type:complete len:119 (-) Transcript_32934:55-411(-)
MALRTFDVVAAILFLNSDSAVRAIRKIAVLEPIWAHFLSQSFLAVLFGLVDLPRDLAAAAEFEVAVNAGSFLRILLIAGSYFVAAGIWAVDSFGVCHHFVVLLKCFVLLELLWGKKPF